MFDKIATNLKALSGNILTSLTFAYLLIGGPAGNVYQVANVFHVFSLCSCFYLFALLLILYIHIKNIICIMSRYHTNTLLGGYNVHKMMSASSSASETVNGEPQSNSNVSITPWHQFAQLKELLHIVLDQVAIVSSR